MHTFALCNREPINQSAFAIGITNLESQDCSSMPKTHACLCQKVFAPRARAPVFEVNKCNQLSRPGISSLPLFFILISCPHLSHSRTKETQGGKGGDKRETSTNAARCILMFLQRFVQKTPMIGCVWGKWRVRREEVGSRSTK